MEITNNEAIALLERAAERGDAMLEMAEICPCEARAIVRLLKGYEPRVMTLEELYDAEYVFYEDNKIGILCVLPCGGDEDDWYFTSAHCIIIQRRKNNYKKSWRCWTSRPTDEQRKAVKWDGDC